MPRVGCCEPRPAATARAGCCGAGVRPGGSGPAWRPPPAAGAAQVAGEHAGGLPGQVLRRVLIMPASCLHAAPAAAPAPVRPRRRRPARRQTPSRRRGGIGDTARPSPGRPRRRHALPSPPALARTADRLPAHGPERRPSPAVAAPPGRASCWAATVGSLSVLAAAADAGPAGLRATGRGRGRRGRGGGLRLHRARRRPRMPCWAVRRCRRADPRRPRR